MWSKEFCATMQQRSKNDKKTEIEMALQKNVQKKVVMIVLQQELCMEHNSVPFMSEIHKQKVVKPMEMPVRQCN